MPIFDFKCPKCEQVREEVILSSSPKPEDMICYECGHEGLERILSGQPSFRLYGQGFYKRDHKDTGDFA